MQEEELAAIRAQQRAYDEVRGSEQCEQQRLEEDELRRVDERERRKEQELEAEAKRRQVQEKTAAQAFARAYIDQLLPSVFERLTAEGFFYDPVERETEREFMPWLLERVDYRLLEMEAAEEILQGSLAWTIFL